MNENTMPNSRVDDDDVEIDLGEVFGAILHRIWIILLVAVVCAGVTYAVSRFVLPEEFESTTQIYVLSRSDGDRSTVTTSDLQAGTQLTKDYAAIITSRYVLEKVINNLHLDKTFEQLSSQVDVTTPTDTRIISITVTDTDPAMAQQIANEIRIEASEHIQNVMAIDAVNVVEEANYPTEKSAPHNTRNAVIGGLVGLLAAIVVVVIRYISDDSIKTQEDVEKYLGLSVLALIPLDEEISKNSVESSEGGRKGRGSSAGHKASNKTSPGRQHSSSSLAVGRNGNGTNVNSSRDGSAEHHHARHADESRYHDAAADVNPPERRRDRGQQEQAARNMAAAETGARQGKGSRTEDRKEGPGRNSGGSSGRNVGQNASGAAAMSSHARADSAMADSAIADDSTSIIDLEEF